ncbi:MAG TPA: Gfo/Idh/MocA family oxidoreductase [Opitutaceae bacterium]|nr:Gfo/Idh/MocA family oxidoreductase [Opitutaceae bacterium]
MKPIRVAIAGMGGFAGSHHHAVARLEERGLAKLVATCDPQPEAFEAEQFSWRFGSRGVQVFADYRAMLGACHPELDVVVLPTPIQLHAEMHAAATALGLPTYLEKPPTLDYRELEAMIAADTRARRASLVGFNFIIEKARLSLKERLLAGEFGAIRGATLSALWPRPASYFARNAWAGRLVVGEHIVVDSCFGNAMAHFVHNLLFWTGGPELFSWAQLAAVRAELYRAHAIEGADTFFVEMDTTTGITMRFALSHACAGASTHTEIVLCDKAALRYAVGRQIEIRWNDGRSERIDLEPFDPLAENHADYYRYLRGETDRPATTLVDSRPFVALNDLAYVSSGRIAAIPPELISGVRDEKDQKDYLQVAGMPATQENFLVRGVWPGASGWARDPGEVVTPADLPRFHEVVRAMTGIRETPGAHLQAREKS